MVSKEREREREGGGEREEIAMTNLYSIHRFGAYLVQEELAQAGDVLTVFFAILIGAFVIGQAGPNLQKLVQSQAAAGAVYQVIDRVRLLPLAMRSNPFHCVHLV